MVSDGMALEHFEAVWPDCTALRVEGDEMSPTMRDGDWVLVDLAENHWVADDLYAVRDSRGVICVKRLQFLSGRRFRVISDNREYENYEMPIASVPIIGRVAAIVQKRRR